MHQPAVVFWANATGAVMLIFSDEALSVCTSIVTGGHANLGIVAILSGVILENKISNKRKPRLEVSSIELQKLPLQQ
jgi:hypothetical protein